MRIATYNLWNSPFDWSRRLTAIVDELAALDADVVALQEAPTCAGDGLSFADTLRGRTAYPYVLHLAYPGPPAIDERPEGLALLSKLPPTEVAVNWDGGKDTANSWAARAVLSWQGETLGVTNAHLDWEHSAGRERQILRIVRDMVERQPCTYDVLCGDFNDGDTSLVARFLEGSASVGGYVTTWRDLAREGRGGITPATLDFGGNPRFQGKGVNRPAERFDRVYLRDDARSRGIRVRRAGLFGREPANRFGIVPSDHYGVWVDVCERESDPSR